MEKKLSVREHNKKWDDHWESMRSYLKERLGDCATICDLHSLGISNNRRCYQVYGAEQSFKFDDNNRVYIKAENKQTGKFVKVYQYDFDKQELKRCSQAHIIHNNYNEEEIQFLRDLRDAVVDYYRPNSIKFITDNF